LHNRILIIDDDLTILETVSNILENLGYKVEVASKAQEGLKKAYETKPDLIILDVMLPGMDGWETCQRFREMSNVPIMMLTALGTEDNVVKGLELGADDYLVKPVTMKELGARVKALLRRAYSTNSSATEMSKIIQHEGLVIDFDKHEVMLNNKRIDLSPTEFKLLSCLVKYKGRVLQHDFLLQQVWGPEYTGELDHLRLYISYLRKKIETDPSKPELIQNEWGVGYRFG
jgi:two-component system alkaline phosphatase synthesis response regulator PhoP